MEALKKDESKAQKLVEYIEQHLETNEDQTIEQKWSECAKTEDSSKGNTRNKAR